MIMIRKNVISNFHNNEANTQSCSGGTGRLSPGGEACRALSCSRKDRENDRVPVVNCVGEAGLGAQARACAWITVFLLKKYQRTTERL